MTTKEFTKKIEAIVAESQELVTVETVATTEKGVHPLSTIVLCNSDSESKNMAVSSSVGSLQPRNQVNNMPKLVEMHELEDCHVVMEFEVDPAYFKGSPNASAHVVQEETTLQKRKACGN